MDVNNLPRVVTPPQADQSLNPRPLNEQSDVLPFATMPPHKYHEIQHLAEAKFYSTSSSDYFLVKSRSPEIGYSTGTMKRKYLSPLITNLFRLQIFSSLVKEILDKLRARFTYPSRGHAAYAAWNIHRVICIRTHHSAVLRCASHSLLHSSPKTHRYTFISMNNLSTTSGL